MSPTPTPGICTSEGPARGGGVQSSALATGWRPIGLFLIQREGLTKHRQVGTACGGDGVTLGGGLRLGGGGKAGPNNTRCRKSWGPVSHGGAGPAVGPPGFRCHFLPSTLEKTNHLNRLHMLLRELREGSTAAFPPPPNRKSIQTLLSLL